MNISRSSVVRISSSALLAAVVTLGAHTFVPAAYGCSQPGGAECKTSTGKSASNSTTEGFVSQFDTILTILKVLIP